jgi:hypothetical protein
LHYVIHAYDQPALASRALLAAEAFARVADGVPHQIHMPSHIYSDLGMWSDSVSANIGSLNAAYAVANVRTGDWYHGSFFMQFAMLQLAMDCDANAFMQAYRAFGSDATDQLFAFEGDAAAKIPVMYLIETKDWQASANFNLSTWYNTSNAIWNNQPYTNIYDGFVNTVGRVMLDFPTADVQAAVASVVAANVSLYKDPDWDIIQLPYWRHSFDLMVMEAQAWGAFRAQSIDEGIAAMQACVSFQTTAWYPEIAHTWDANEQLAQMYLMRNSTQLNDVSSARSAYETAISVYPHRYNSLAGAAETSVLLQDQAKACDYYSQLLALTAGPLPSMTVTGITPAECPAYYVGRRPALAAAEAYVADPANKCGTVPDPTASSADQEPSSGIYVVLGVVGGLLAVGLVVWTARHFKRKQADSTYELLQGEVSM